MSGHRAAQAKGAPGGTGEAGAPGPAADAKTCQACVLTDPPPEPTCRDGRDHRVGTAAGCPHCGRLAEACARRPCFGSMHEAAMTTRLIRLSRLARRLVMGPVADRAGQ